MTTSEPRPEAARDAAPGRAPVGPRILGGVLLLTGGYLLVDSILAAREYGVTLDGPRLAPIVVTAGWVVISAAYLVRQFVAPTTDHPPTAEQTIAAQTIAAQPRADPPSVDQPRADQPGAEPAGPTHWLAPAALVAVLVAYVLVLGYTVVGYVLTTTAFFVAGAWLLGSRRPVRDLIVGVVLALTVYLAFTRLLGIQLPMGVLLPL